MAAERMAGRRVLVYATHTGTRDITERMDDILTRHGFRVAVMKADAVAPNRREAWVADKVKQGIDVLICHPRLVQTGLDLIDFPTIVWGRDGLQRLCLQTGVPPFLAHRADPPGQGGVHVLPEHPTGRRAEAGGEEAAKLPGGGGRAAGGRLAAYGDDGDDLMMALARKIVSGDEDEAETVEAVFAQARDAEATAEELLVDDGWKVVEIEPEAIAVNGNGHDANVIGRRSSLSRSTVTPLTATERTSRRSLAATATCLLTRQAVTRPLSRSRRCSPGRSSWPRSRSSPGAGAASLSPQPRPCSNGR